MGVTYDTLPVTSVGRGGVPAATEVGFECGEGGGVGGVGVGGCGGGEERDCEGEGEKKEEGEEFG